MRVKVAPESRLASGADRPPVKVSSEVETAGLTPPRVTPQRPLAQARKRCHSLPTRVTLLSVERMKLDTSQIGFYKPSERAREKARQRRQDADDVRAGRLAEVERRNRRLPGARAVLAWETTPPLE